MSSQIRWLVAIHVCGIVVWNIQYFKTNKLFYWSPYLSISSWSVVIYGYVSPCKLKLNFLHLLMYIERFKRQWKHNHSRIHLLQTPNSHSSLILSEGTQTQPSSGNPFLRYITSPENTNWQNCTPSDRQMRRKSFRGVNRNPIFTSKRNGNLRVLRSLTDLKHGDRGGGRSIPNACQLCDKHTLPISITSGTESWQGENGTSHRRKHHEDSKDVGQNNHWQRRKQPKMWCREWRR